MQLGACLATHLRNPKEGFRQKDLKFLIELMETWRYSKWERYEFPQLHNTQVLRIIRELAERGWLKKTAKKGLSFSKLSRGGLIGASQELRQKSHRSNHGDFLFIHYLFKLYGQRLRQAIELEGEKLTPLALSDIERVFDTSSLLKERASRLQSQMEYWQLRMKEAQEVSQIVDSELKGSRAFESLLLEMDQRYPYELKAKKPLASFLKEVPEELSRFELTQGHQARSRFLWSQYQKDLESQIREITSLGSVKV